MGNSKNKKKRQYSLLETVVKKVVYPALLDSLGYILFFLLFFYSYVGFWAISDAYLMSLPLFILFILFDVGLFIILHSLFVSLFKRLTYQLVTDKKFPFFLFFKTHIYWTIPWVFLFIIGGIIFTELTYSLYLSLLIVAYVFFTFFLRISIQKKKTIDTMKKNISKLKQLVFPTFFGILLFWILGAAEGFLLQSYEIALVVVFCTTIILYISWFRYYMYYNLTKL